MVLCGSQRVVPERHYSTDSRGVREREKEREKDSNGLKWGEVKSTGHRPTVRAVNTAERKCQEVASAQMVIGEVSDTHALHCANPSHKAPTMESLCLFDILTTVTVQE